MQQQNIAMQHNLEEDEIDLKELFSTIWNNKFKIVFFVFIVTSLTIIYTLSLPNSYISQTLLVPQTKAKTSLGGLGALAGMAGIDIGSSGGDIDIEASLNTILKDFEFEKRLIKKYNLVEKLKPKKENLVFALSYDGIYNFLHKAKKDEKLSYDDMVFNTYKTILDTISITKDKKSGIISLKAENPDRFLAKELVNIYLKELTSHLRDIEMKDIQKQIDYYTKEMQIVDEISMKEQLSQLSSSLIQKKVLSKANEFYNVRQFTKAQVAYIKDKSKPKRALIVIVGFITSFILGIFMVFLLEFIKKEN